MSEPSLPMNYDQVQSMNPLSVTAIKGTVGLASAGVANVASYLPSVPSWVPSFTVYCGCAVAFLTGISVLLDIRKKWRDRNK